MLPSYFFQKYFSRRHMHRYRIPAILAGAFLLGACTGKLVTVISSHTSKSELSESASETVSCSSASSNWGLSFQEKGCRPVGNASIQELKEYNAYYARNTEEKVLYLTFDAGYENGNTPAILDALKKHHAPATFFAVGNFLKDNPDLIKRIVSEGHLVGNHTMTHPDMSQISSPETFQKELQEVESLYQQITGQSMPKFYRPPRGIYSTQNLTMAKELGYSTFFWSLAYVD